MSLTIIGVGEQKKRLCELFCMVDSHMKDQVDERWKNLLVGHHLFTPSLSLGVEIVSSLYGSGLIGTWRAWRALQKMELSKTDKTLDRLDPMILWQTVEQAGIVWHETLEKLARTLSVESFQLDQIYVAEGRAIITAVFEPFLLNIGLCDKQINDGVSWWGAFTHEYYRWVQVQLERTAFYLWGEVGFDENMHLVLTSRK